MLNQKQALESVKSNVYSKKLKNPLVDSFIKSKLYALMLLTVTTGGIVIGNMVIPAQVPPVQAQVSKLVEIAGGAIRGITRINADELIQWQCRGLEYGGGYHRVEIFTEGGELIRRIIAEINGPATEPISLPRGTYIQRVDGIEQSGVIEVQ